MGIAEKEKIHEILKKSVSKIPNDLKGQKIEYKYLSDCIEVSEIQDKDSDINYDEHDDSFDFSLEEITNLKSAVLDIRNIKKFPYNTVGFLRVIFPAIEKEYIYTCFIIDRNVVVTLASNLNDKNKGGKAKSIFTSFNEEQVKWENIYLLDEFENKTKRCTSIHLNNKTSIAIILYEDSIFREWIGVEQGNQEDFNGRDLNAIFYTITEINNEENNEENDKENYNSKKKMILKEINVTNNNPFKNWEEKALIEVCPGSPIYYKDYNSGAYVVAIINEVYEFQYFDESDIKFLLDMVNKGKLLRKKEFKDIEEDNIVKLDMSRNNFSSFDIKYFIKFDLINLRILDLSYNSIGVQGTLYLSQGKFSYLESLDLNSNKIGDEGVLNISNGFFSKLSYLYFMNNNISYKGINYLMKAEFIPNLIILTLDENEKIGNKGIEIMKEFKSWDKLHTLNLNKIGISDESLIYFEKVRMPKLKELNIIGNKFTENVKNSIEPFKMNNILVNYTEKERELEYRYSEHDIRELEDEIKTKNIENNNKVIKQEIEILKKFKDNSLDKFLNF